PRDRGAGPDRPTVPVRCQPVERPAQVDDHAPADVAARHAAPGAARDERRSGVRGPADEALELLDALRDHDARGHDPIDAGALGIGGTNARIGQETGEAGGAHGGTYHARSRLDTATGPGDASTFYGDRRGARAAHPHRD